MSPEWEEDIDRAMEEHPGRIQELEARVEEYRREVERREEMIAAADHLHAELQAECAATREAINVHGECFTACPRCGEEISNTDDDMMLALAPEAGRALLERLEKAEAALKLSEEFDQDWDEAVAKVRAHAIEEAANVAENGRFLHDDAPDARFGKECAAAIRALKTK